MIKINTVTEALAVSDSWQQAYEREAAAHADTLRELQLQRMLADDFAYALERQWAKDKFADL